MNSRQADLAKIHIAKKGLALDDATYRQVILNVSAGRTSSSAKLTAEERGKALHHFRAHGWKPKPQPGQKNSPASRHKARKTPVDKIRAMWIQMHRDGIVKNGSEPALCAFVEHLTGVENVEWLRGRDAAQVIEALKQWRRRVKKP